MLTAKKNLRTGRPVWCSYPVPSIPTAPLKADLSTDIVIVGAGISGAMLAETLATAGFKVIIIDRRGPLKGSTSATTALLQYEIDEPLTHLGRKIGTDNAIRAWRRSKLGLESLSAKIQSLDIHCTYKRTHSLYLAGNVLNAESLLAEKKAREAIGLHTEYLTRKQLLDFNGIRRNAALLTYYSLSINPLQLAAGLLKNALKQSAQIFAPVTAIEIDAESQKVRVNTKEGPIITAKHIIFATGYEIPKYIHAKHHTIHSTWAIATKPQPQKLWPDNGMIWEASDPYLYIRSTKGGRIICGGEDETFSDEEKRDGLIKRKTSILERKLGVLFPQVDSSAEFAWTGSFGASKTGLPVIGTVPGLKNCLAVMGFGGNGITYSQIASELIRSLLTGKQDPEEDLFAFH